MAQPDNFVEQKIDDYMNKIRYNSDDFVWILFQKPCGYSFINPFPRNAPVNALYNHLDCLWSDTINHIWLSSNSNNTGMYINRNNMTKIRTWLSENNITSFSSYPLVYRVYFDTQTVPNLSLNCNKHCC